MACLPKFDPNEPAESPSANRRNRALTDCYEPGSTFKTFVLLTALEQGVQPNDFVSGSGSWPNKGGTPDPYTVSGSSGTLDTITSASSNGAFVRLGATVGREHVIDMAERLGVTSEFDPRVIPLPLGVFDVTPLEMASAYSAIPNGGVRQESYFVERIEDRDGNVLYTHAGTPTRAFSPQTACLATEILEHNVRGGTGRNAQLGSQPAAGKTGTKEMLRACLKVCASSPERVHAPEKSFNNHWGVPLTLARMPANTEYAVFEIGMNHAGEIRPLTKMVLPHVAVVTNVLPVHVGNFENGEIGVACAKAEIFEGLRAGGTAIILRDSPHYELLRKAADNCGARVLTFGLHREADFGTVDHRLAMKADHVDCRMS
jgi:hypothetical protein